MSFSFIEPGYLLRGGVKYYDNNREHTESIQWQVLFLYSSAPKYRRTSKDKCLQPFLQVSQAFYQSLSKKDKSSDRVLVRCALNAYLLNLSCPNFLRLRMKICLFWLVARALVIFILQKLRHREVQSILTEHRALCASIPASNTRKYYSVLFIIAQCCLSPTYLFIHLPTGTTLLKTESYGIVSGFKELGVSWVTVAHEHIVQNVNYANGSGSL